MQNALSRFGNSEQFCMVGAWGGAERGRLGQVN